MVKCAPQHCTFDIMNYPNAVLTDPAESSSDNCAKATIMTVFVGLCLPPLVFNHGNIIISDPLCRTQKDFSASGVQRGTGIILSLPRKCT